MHTYTHTRSTGTRREREKPDNRFLATKQNVRGKQLLFNFLLMFFSSNFLFSLQMMGGEFSLIHRQEELPPLPTVLHPQLWTWSDKAGEWLKKDDNCGHGNEQNDCNFQTLIHNGLNCYCDNDHWHKHLLQSWQKNICWHRVDEYEVTVQIKIIGERFTVNTFGEMEKGEKWETASIFPSTTASSSVTNTRLSTHRTPAHARTILDVTALYYYISVTAHGLSVTASPGIRQAMPLLVNTTNVTFYTQQQRTKSRQSLVNSK